MNNQPEMNVASLWAYGIYEYTTDLKLELIDFWEEDLTILFLL